MNNEKDVKRKVKALLTKHGWFWWMPPSNAFGRTGIADFGAVRAGVFMAIETKFGGNKPTAMQLAFLTSVQAESCLAFVVDEARVSVLQRWLEAFDASTEAVAAKREVTPEDGATMVNCIRVLTAEIT